MATYIWQTQFCMPLKASDYHVSSMVFISVVEFFKLPFVAFASFVEKDLRHSLTLHCLSETAPVVYASSASDSSVTSSYTGRHGK